MNILLIAPYPNLVKTAQRTLAASPYSVEVLLGDLQQGLHAAETKINRNEADIIVSRGGTASLLRQNLSIPVFEIDVTGYDLLRAIYPHTQRHRKIAVIGYENVISGARSIAETLHINLGYFQVNPQQHIEAVIREAREWGAHIIIGDTISVHTAREQGLESELVQSGPEAVLSAVESAANFIGHMQTEIVRNKRLNMIMEHADRGVIYIAADNCVEMLNTKAEQILQRNREQLVGRPLTLDTAPAELVKAVTKRVSHQLIRFDDKDYMLEVLEINTEGRHAATLVFLQSSGRIRDLEGMLRREMISRGLIATYFFSQLTAENSMFKKTIEKARRYSHTN
ncbi:MAG: PrpR N-terminal domain-containing protein [Spirochaetaceae bacterium]|nr:PrpR N-terminal domain-containing protein [Spirochaetaceae bacterium]MCF7939162.1 PrpR N-terminal domain-containing protein [Spirochaetales bacterium]